MNRMTRTGIFLAVTVFLLSSAWAAGGDVVTNKITKDGYAFMIHLKAIPDEYKKAAKGSHHLGIVIMDSGRKEVVGAVVAYEFAQNGKVVASGTLPWMKGGMGMGPGIGPGMGPGGGQGRGRRRGNNSNMGMGGQGKNMKTGHYGSDVNLPGPGAYNLNITMTREGATIKAATLITAP